MQKSWLRPRWFRAVVLASAAAGAYGAACSQVAPAVVIGQPLNFSVQLRGDTGEPITPECVTAEVSVGDRKLPAAQVRAALVSTGADGARIRVFTLQRIEEPVVSVQLSIGCQTRVTRRYMLMAEVATTTTLAAPLQALAPRAATVERATPPAPPPRATVAGPRLRLDAAPPALSAESAAVEQAIEVVAQAAGAMRAVMAAASAAEQRVKTLELSVAQARNEASAQRALVLNLQAEAAASEAATRWLWPLQIALLAAALLAAALAWQLWKRPSAPARLPVWRDAKESAFDDMALEPALSGRAATAPTPFVASEIVLPAPAPAANLSALGRVALLDEAASHAHTGSPSARSRRSHPEPEAATGPAFNERTAPLPAGLGIGMVTGQAEGAPRDVSIEELIDLEQQAEFFVVLGQDGAAIELLVEHLRLTGGGSPLPYLKLMEIYHRRLDQAAYERTRGRFNDRFNAYAPAWAAGLQQGRGLEDYPGVVPRLCQVWARPLDAMAELEALLFRKSRGDLFELPAYREVLFLYALARDLFDRESADAVNVDLLLPLNSHGDNHATRPTPFVDSGRAALDGEDDLSGRPTAPVDLDLSTPDKSTSIFDPFEPRTSPGSR